MYAVQDLLLRLKNPQTKLVYFHYLKLRDALDPSVGLIYTRRAYEVARIY